MKFVITFVLFFFGCAASGPLPPLKPMVFGPKKVAPKTKTVLPKLPDPCPTFPEGYNFLSPEELERIEVSSMYDSEGIIPVVDSIEGPEGYPVPNLPFDRETNCKRMAHIAKYYYQDQATDEAKIDPPEYKINWLFGSCVGWVYAFVTQIISYKELRYKELLFQVRPIYCGRYSIVPVQVLKEGRYVKK